MVGINLFGFRKFELLRGGDGGGEGGGGGPGGDDGTGATDAGNQGGLSAGTSGGVDGDLGEFGGSGPDVSAQGNVGSFDPGFAPDDQFSNEDVGLGAVSANTQNFGVSPGQASAQFGTTSAGVGLSGSQQADVNSEMGNTSFNDNAAGFNAAQENAQAQADAQAASISFAPSINDLEALSTSPSGNLNIDAIASVNEALNNQNPNNPAAAESLMGAPLSGSGGYDIGIGDGVSMPLGMSPAKAQAMTGGSMSTTNNTGMNLAQQTDNIEAEKQAAAMDVLGAQIGAGNLTGNEDIDQVNQELAKQGVQIDSGLPGLLGTGVNAFNQNYQLNKNQDILTQLAQGTGNDDATNTGILGTGIGAVKGVNTYKPAYNAQGQIVGSVATDAAGNAVGGPAGITTNVVGGINAMPELYSDAAGTKLYTGANQAVGDFQEMAAASQSSEEGPPEDVTSVDANGCVIGAEFFDGQKCSPIGSGTGDGTGGGTGGAFTPYNYQPGQGTMLRPDFSDMYTSNVQFNTLNPNASNMNFLKPAVNPYGNFAGGGIVPMMRNNRYR